jgi:hypothetical protein
MDAPEPRKPIRRRHWHSWSRTKIILTVVGSLSVAIGGWICIAPAFLENHSAQLVGCGYILLGGLLLVSRTLLSGLQDYRRRTEYRHEKRKRGVVLIVVLVMTAILATLTLHTQALTVTSLKLAHIRQQHDQRLSAATDGTWTSLHLFVNRTTEIEQKIADDAAILNYILPNDIKVSSTIKKAAAPKSTNSSSDKKNLHFYELHTLAEFDDRETDIYCLFSYNNSGTIQVARWLESN